MANWSLHLSLKKSPATSLIRLSFSIWSREPMKSDQLNSITWPFSVSLYCDHILRILKNLNTQGIEKQTHYASIFARKSEVLQYSTDCGQLNQQKIHKGFFLWTGVVGPSDTWTKHGLDSYLSSIKSISPLGFDRSPTGWSNFLCISWTLPQ